MSKMVTLRQDALARIGQERSAIALAIEEVSEIDHLLEANWNISFLESRTGLAEQLAAISDRAARARATDALRDVSARLSNGRGKGTKEDERELYEAADNPEALGIITSTRRHFILDTVALCLGLVRKLGIAGDILDVGCHAGFVAHTLGHFVSNRIIGIDPAASAIGLGRRKLSDGDKVELHEASIPWSTERTFEVAIALDVLPERSIADRATFLASIGELLVDGGLAIVVSPVWVTCDIDITRRQLARANLGYGMADVVGGYGGAPSAFMATGYIVFVKGGSNPIPRKIRAIMEADWEMFARFANTSTTPNSRKTQAYARASGYSWPTRSGESR